MTIEEKAKRYDEALARANEMVKAMTNIGGVAKVDDIQHIFPELRESEDEKIRKWLIALIKSNEYGSISNVGEMPCPKLNVLAWLEKHGEQKSAWKPTGAQLASLEIACDRNDRIGFDLTELLKDLKKL